MHPKSGRISRAGAVRAAARDRSNSRPRNHAVPVALARDPLPLPDGARVAVVLGTRPEIIKLAPVIEALGASAWVIHTGQHYDAELSDRFFDDLGLQPAAEVLGVGGRRRGSQIGLGLEALDLLFASRRPHAVVVQGDTNATLAGAIAANASDVPLVHVEAGLRSFDRAMPEEHNRVLVDHLSDLRCAATVGNVENLAREGITDGVVVTGNTVVESVERNLAAPAVRRHLVASLGVEPDEYVLATVHRPENTDDPANLAAILRALRSSGRPTVLPLHPRTRAAIERCGLEPLLHDMIVTAPLGMFDFLSIAAHAGLIVSDSGGVQEECTVLKRPLVVVRNSTERPESLDHFAQLVRPPHLAEAMASALGRGPGLLEELATIPSPFGDGSATTRIVEHLAALLHARRAAPERVRAV